MSKRKHEELEQPGLYGHGRKWFRGPMIGKGSSGSVYLATSKEPKSRLTHFPAQMAVKSAEISDSCTLQKERMVLSNLQGCPYVRCCYGEEITYGERGEMVYNLLLEYGSAGTLADMIKKTGRTGLPESDVQRYTRYIVLGLQSIHRYGYVLRDLKPENIILFPITSASNSTKYVVKIGDYGSAKKVMSMKKRRLNPYLRGNIKYLSPEVVFDGKQVPPGDIWALGCLVVEMLTGKSLWDGKKDKEIEDILYEIGEGHGLIMFE
ncbi:unnamed protein product, partial [Ilex paraguariensis]